MHAGLRGQAQHLLCAPARKPLCVCSLCLRKRQRLTLPPAAVHAACAALMWRSCQTRSRPTSESFRTTCADPATGTWTRKHTKEAAPGCAAGIFPRIACSVKTSRLEDATRQAGTAAVPFPSPRARLRSSIFSVCPLPPPAKRFRAPFSGAMRRGWVSPSLRPAESMDLMRI